MTAETYVPERPCKRGHFLRYEKNGVCVPCQLMKVKEWRAANPHKCVKYDSRPGKAVQRERWKKANRRRVAETQRLHSQRIKLSVMQHYGACRCSRCGIADIDVLCIDHIHNNGAAHRREIPSGSLYQWLVNNGFPAGFQVLCANCNLKKEIERKRAVALYGREFSSSIGIDNQLAVS